MRKETDFRKAAFFCAGVKFAELAFASFVMDSIAFFWLSVCALAAGVAAASIFGGTVVPWAAAKT